MAVKQEVVGSDLGRGDQCETIIVPLNKVLNVEYFKVTVPVLSVKRQITESDQNVTLICNIESVKTGYMAGFPSYCQLQENNGQQRGMFL